MTNPADDTLASAATAGPAPGWYPDPWRADQQRYWDGATWTGHVYATIPVSPGPAWPSAGPASAPATAGWATTAAVAATPTAADTSAQATPWAVPATRAAADTSAQATPWWVGTTPADTPADTLADTPAVPPVSPPATPSPDPGAAKRSRRAFIVGLIVLALLAFFGAFGTALAIGHHSRSTRSSAPPVTPLPSPNTTAPNQAPAAPADPSAATLSGLGIVRSDLAPTVPFGLLPGGTSVTGQTTLDLCNGTFPSETLRTARRQVEVAGAQGNVTLSTESVLYTSPSATAQAFSELKSVVAKCPATAVPSPVGEATVTTHFNAAPDGSWPQVAGVERLAYDFTATDSSGQTQHGIAVYLRHGRVLMGVYFDQPSGTQVAVAGQTTIPGIVNVFANRLAKVPASVANGVATT